MASKISINSIDSDVFFGEQIFSEPSPQRNISLNYINSTEQLRTHTKEMPKYSSFASSESDIVSIDDNSNEPTFRYGLGAQQPIVPPSLNNLNLPPNPYNILAAMTVIQQNRTQRDGNYSPQSPEPSELSPIATPPMNLSAIVAWGTPHTTTDDNTFNSEDGPRRVHWSSLLDETFHSGGEPKRIYLLPSPSPPSPIPKMKRKLEIEMLLPKEWECRSTSAQPADK